jgi:TatD DNase family protein
MRQLPPLDLHAHVDPSIKPGDLQALGAVVFAATRSIAEWESTRSRQDQVTIWGVGCHPGLVGAHRDFTPARFETAVQKTPFVSEVGMDGASRVPAETQQGTLHQVLDILADSPRIVSIHSYQATTPVLDLLERHPAHGVILHWWLGTESETRRAVDLGCYFSINYSAARRREQLALIPQERMLLETDHPAGDRFSPPPRQPGHVQPTEAIVAKHLATTPERVRTIAWQNFRSLLGPHRDALAQMMPAPVQRMIDAIPHGT